MDGHDDDIRILPDFEEDSSLTTTSVSAGLVTFSVGSSDVPASNHALQKAYKDLRNRFNEIQQQNKVLRRKTRVGGVQRMATGNGLFSGSTGTPVDIREQGAAAMAESRLDDQVKQGLINHLQLQLNQIQTKYSTLESELNRTHQQFDEFRSKHARCFQEKDALFSQNRQIEIEKRKLIETVEKLKAKIENQASCKNCNHLVKNVGEEGPASFPGNQKGVCVVSLDEFEKLQEQMHLTRKNVSALQTVVGRYNHTIQAKFGGQPLSDINQTDLAAGLVHMADLELSLHGHGDNVWGPMEDENQERQLPKDGTGDVRFRLERQDQVRDERGSIGEGYHPYMRDSVRDFKDETKLPLQYRDNSRKPLATSYSLQNEKFSENDRSQHDVDPLELPLSDSSLEMTYMDANHTRILPSSSMSTFMTSNIMRKEAQHVLDRIASAISRTSSTPQPNSHLLRVAKEPVARTSSSPVQFNRSLSGEANNQQSLSEIKNPAMLEPVHLPSTNQPDITTTLISSLTPVQRLLTTETKDSTPGFPNSSLHASSANPTDALMSRALRETLPGPQASENSTQVTIPGPSDSQRVCPICGRAFSHLTMTEFQNHVFDCYDNTDSGEIDRPEITSDHPEVNKPQINMVCPICDVRFENAIPQNIFERHVEEHFDDAPLNNDDFTILHP